MPHKGYTNPIMNNGPGFHSDIPVSELNPSVAETVDEVTHKTRSTPTMPNGARGLELPSPNLGTRPTAQVTVRTNTGEHPDRKENKSP